MNFGRTTVKIHCVLLSLTVAFVMTTMSLITQKTFARLSLSAYEAANRTTSRMSVDLVVLLIISTSAYGTIYNKTFF